MCSGRMVQGGEKTREEEVRRGMEAEREEQRGTEREGGE